jgi:pyrimidine-specific ribonucleoside hydrolase
MNNLSNPEPHHLQTLIYRFVPIVAVIGALVQLVTLWAGLADLQTDWQVTNILPTVAPLLDYDAFLLYVVFLRWLTMVLAWAAAFVLFRRVAFRSASPHWAASLTALLLALLPGLLIMNVGARLDIPAPWDQILLLLSIALAAVALVGLILFGFLFPNLRFIPAWAGWLAVPLSIAVVLGMSGILGGDEFFLVTMLLLVSTLLFGVGSQIYRYLRRADDTQRRQTGWVVIALALLPSSFILSIFLEGRGWPSLIALHLQYLGAAMLPVAILAAVLRRGLWTDATPLQPKQRKFQWAGIAAVFVLGYAALALGLVMPTRAEELQFEPLPASSTPRPVIIDTDMAPDDWMAILFLLQRPEIEVQAITVTGTGEAHCDPGVQNALGLVALSGESGIPVACGRETPLQGDNVFPEAWRQAADTMTGLSLPPVEPPETDQDAVALLAHILGQSPQKVTMLVLGPLTNLADGLQKDPDFLANTEMIYIMGGALNVTGNVWYSGIDNQVAEWNIYIDPLAAQIVFESGVPLTLVPLDATNKVPANLEFVRLLQANRHTPEADFVYQILQQKMADMANETYSFWDPLAAGLLADESLGYFKEGPVKIYAAPGPSNGLTRLIQGGAPMRYATSADRQRFEYELLRTLNQP